MASVAYLDATYYVGRAPVVRESDHAGGRVYAMKYPPDKPGEEHKENARVWNVLLDETKDHNRDMLQGFRDIIDGVLIFASLFSAVVTTLVAQTSQALQPNNAQITASLLVETNQLLRAAGNITTISTVPKSPLSVGSTVHTSKDVWVNALFFTSLALSLSTALLTVLVKQWLHAYSSFIKGDARSRAFITDFRSQGLRTWRVREIVEALPLILHGSVLLFFVGLVLYVSQLSAPICGILAFVTALSFTFYLESSFLPSVFPSCPYKIPFLINVGRSIILSVCSITIFVLSLILRASNIIPKWLQNACQKTDLRCRSLWRQVRPFDSRDNTVPPKRTGLMILDSLQRLLQTSSQLATYTVICEAVFALLQDQEESEDIASRPYQHQILWRAAFRYSLYEYPRLSRSTSPEAREVDDARKTWETRISCLFKHLTIHHRERMRMLCDCYITAEHLGNEFAYERVLDWIGNVQLGDKDNISMVKQLLSDCVTGNGVRRILTRLRPARTAMLLRMPVQAVQEESLLHYFIRQKYLDAAKAVIEADHSDDVINCISATGQTPLDIVICQWSLDPQFMGYLMDHGARASQSSYEGAFIHGLIKWTSNPSLLRHWWSRRREVRLVDTRPNSWCRKSVVEVANMLVFAESWRRPNLIQSLQGCVYPSEGQDQPPISPSVEGQSSLPHPISELEGTVDLARRSPHPQHRSSTAVTGLGRFGFSLRYNT
ncbi:hypothetical protein H0H93_016652 [Arthromyces matolae]|nr:hypothetical protein H0H93_016652 [Arthromyces matolae]